MEMIYGKHAYRSVESVMINDPGYVRWLSRKPDLYGHLLTVSLEMERLMRIFDSKPFIIHCKGENCQRLATRAFIISKRDHLCFFCDQCEPKDRAKFPKYTILRTYEDVLNFLGRYRGTKDEYGGMIKTFARAKGLPVGFTKENLLEFFRLPSNRLSTPV